MRTPPHNLTQLLDLKKTPLVSASLTLECKVHNAGIEGIHLRVQVSHHVEKIGAPAHQVLREGAVVGAGQGVKGGRLCRGRRVRGQARLGLDLPVKPDGLQGERPHRLGLHLYQVALSGRCPVAAHGRFGLRQLAGPPAAGRAVSDQLVQFLCKEKWPL